MPTGSKLRSCEIRVLRRANVIRTGVNPQKLSTLRLVFFFFKGKMLPPQLCPTARAASKCHADSMQPESRMFETSSQKHCAVKLTVSIKAAAARFSDGSEKPKCPSVEMFRYSQVVEVNSEPPHYGAPYSPGVRPLPMGSFGASSHLPKISNDAP